MISPSLRHWLLPLGLMLGYALVMGTSPVRLALLDGLRVLRRYSRLWGIPAVLGLCYALFRAALQLFFYTVLPDDLRPAFGWRLAWVSPAPPARLREAHTLHDWLATAMQDPRWHLLGRSVLQGLEMVAGLFNNVVTTFPFSAVAALMLLANWQDHHATLCQALRRRFGKGARLVHGGILVCALAAIFKPILYGPSLPYLSRFAPASLLLRGSVIVDWLSFLFEYLFGVCVQIYLILLAYTWMRGLNWTPEHLMDMAIRRFSYVVKWAAAVMAATSLLIDLPRMYTLLFRFDDTASLQHIFAYIDGVARPLLALLLILFCPMQIMLTFHSESLRAALRQNFQFLRRFWWQFGWFLLIAAIHLFALALLEGWLLLGFGEETLGALIWSFVSPVLGALLVAWLLAAWVSLFKRCETGRVQTPDWIPF